MHIVKKESSFTSCSRKKEKHPTNRSIQKGKVTPVEVQKGRKEKKGWCVEMFVQKKEKRKAYFVIRKLRRHHNISPKRKKGTGSHPPSPKENKKGERKEGGGEKRHCPFARGAGGFQNGKRGDEKKVMNKESPQEGERKKGKRIL